MGKKSPVFDQRYQKVNYQYNVDGVINFGNVQNRIDAAREIEKLQAELIKATQSGVLDEEISADIEAKLKKAVIHAKKPEGNPKNILDYLEKEKNLLNGIDTVSGLMKGISEAIETVITFF